MHAKFGIRKKKKNLQGQSRIRNVFVSTSEIWWGLLTVHQRTMKKVKANQDVNRGETGGGDLK